MARGDHLQASRLVYHHDGIDLGDGRVVHFAADKGGSKSTARIRISSWEEFAGDGDVTIREYAGQRDPEAIVERALSRVDATGYDLVFNNCEHFARWCVTGVHQSAQVVGGISAAAVVGLPWISGNVGLSFVAPLGFLGTSGAGIMSGLAAAGALVGGGAVAGIAVFGAIPAVVGTAVIHCFTLVDDNNLPATERRARMAGRVGAIGGGVGGLIGTGWAIGILGLPGFSAAGISSGLATAGSLVGGGMAAGTGLAIAAPVIGVAFGAYFFYRLWPMLEQCWRLLQPFSATDGSAAL